MVLGGIDAVYTDGVYAELLEERYIASTGISVGERVDEVGGFKEGVVGVGRERPCPSPTTTATARACAPTAARAWARVRDLLGLELA